MYYTNCPCCGAVIVADTESALCACCAQAGCEPRESDGIFDSCEIPTCPECEVRATFCTDERWHANCAEPCENAGKSWEA
jgi:hypothetical protein